ncbi:MAG: hypothetical protein ACYDBP_13480 [Leptospirales bacterium]
MGKNTDLAPKNPGLLSFYQMILKGEGARICFFAPDEFSWSPSRFSITLQSLER